MSVYYNENDSFTAAWLRELCKAGLIPDGEVDERSIVDVQPSDLAGFIQCHFFAGIGGWAYALALAGWPSDREVWTGSCPCQPWSIAGGGARTNDQRDLWPAWFKLIEKCKPAIVYGEQVASADGCAWLDRAYADLEGQDYAVASASLCAASVGAPHDGPRLFLVAASGSERRPRLESSADSGATRPWRLRGSQDLQSICDAPFEQGNCWPIPLLRRMDDGISARMEQLRGFGNAIVPQVAQAFIEAYCATEV